ncbi:MAG TPA: PAS domain S-box protein [Vicinamibacterales bacterium]|nr:PAS domain S-box protein [Vicinamibacterales bacterium]
MVAHRFLIVHDDLAVARELEARLAGFGYEVAGIAASAREAAASSLRTPPDLVLMSLAPATASGTVSAAAEVRRRWGVPVIFLAASTDEPLLRRAGVTGPSGYVLEPYPERELRLNIEMALLQEAMKTQAHELEDRFFAVSIDLLCFLDYRGYFKRLNPAWERTLGFTRDELMSKPFIEFVHPDDRARTRSQNRAVRDGEPAVGFENRYLCKDGSFRWFLWNASPDADRRVIYSVARDITDRKLAEEEREGLVRELRAALAEVKSLQEILPICSYCKKIRDDENYWQSVEGYISRHTNATFSHGICPTCYKKEVEPQFDRMKR